MALRISEFISLVPIRNVTGAREIRPSPRSWLTTTRLSHLKYCT